VSTEKFFIGDYFESTLLLSAKKPGGNSREAGPDIFRMKFRLTLRTWFAPLESNMFLEFSRGTMTL